MNTSEPDLHARMLRRGIPAGILHCREQVGPCPCHMFHSVEAELLTPEQEAAVEEALAEGIWELGGRSNRHLDVWEFPASAV